MWGRKKPAQAIKVTPEPGEVAEAAKNPGGWVYRISGNYGPNDAVPPQAIVGAWKVGENGLIEGDFIPNPNFAAAADNR